MRFRRSGEGGDRAARETQILGWILVAPAMLLVAALALATELLLAGFQRLLVPRGIRLLSARAPQRVTTARVA